jgi:Bifunctional DNA primase/polymerase, N-terminal
MEPPSQDADLYEWAAYYASHTLSVIPIAAGSKRPIVAWKPYQLFAADDAQLRSWFSGKQPGDLNLAAVWGPVSDNRVCCDVDLLPLVAFLHGPAHALLACTWTLATGRNKLHLIYQATDTWQSAVIRHLDEHAIDLKGERAYSLLPPSTYDGGSYTTLVGDPTTCATVPDARILAYRIYNTWRQANDLAEVPIPPAGARAAEPVVELPFPAPADAAAATTQARAPYTQRAQIAIATRSNGTAAHEPPDGAAPTPDLGMRILPPPSAEERAFLVRLVTDCPRLTRTEKRLFLRDEFEPEAGLDWRFDWPQIAAHPAGDWHSEVHWAAMLCLHDKIRVPFETAEQVLAACPVGDLCYANRQRPHHGWSLIWGEWQKLSQHPVTTPELEDIQGENFLISTPRRYDYGTEVRYVFEVTDPHTAKTRTVDFKHRELWNQHAVVAEISGRLSLIARFPPHLSGKNWVDGFLQRLLALTVEMAVPEDVQTAGGIRAAIARHAQNELRHGTPELPYQAQMCWIEGETAYLKAGEVMAFLNTTLHQAPPPAQVWKMLIGLGAHRLLHQYKDGSVEEVWAVEGRRLFQQNLYGLPSTGGPNGH